MDWLNDDITDLRQVYLAERSKRLPPLIKKRSVNGPAGNITVLQHRPLNLKSQDFCIVYAHGGGWIVGSPETHADITTYLSLQAGLELFSVDYGLAPECNASQQIAHVLQIMRRLRHRRLILCGDSAGASLVAAAANAAEPALSKRIKAVALIYGYFGLVKDKAFHRFASRSDGMDEACLERYLFAVNHGLSRSPFEGHQLSGLGHFPVYVISGARDPLLGSSLALVQSLRRRGGKVALDIVADGEHGFLHRKLQDTGRQPTLTKLIRWIASVK